MPNAITCHAPMSLADVHMQFKCFQVVALTKFVVYFIVVCLTVLSVTETTHLWLVGCDQCGKHMEGSGYGLT